MINEKEAAYWHTIMNSEAFDRVFGPATRFEPWTGVNDLDRIVQLRLSGGFLQKPNATLDYTFVLIRSSFGKTKGLTHDNLRADLIDDIWHIRTIRSEAGFAAGAEVLTLSRETAQLLSGIL